MTVCSKPTDLFDRWENRKMSPGADGIHFLNVLPIRACVSCFGIDNKYIPQPMNDFMTQEGYMRQGKPIK